MTLRSPAATPPSTLPGAVPERPVVRHVEAAIGYILRIGVGISMSLIVLGMAITHFRHPEFRTESMTLENVSKVATTFPHTISDTLNSVEQLHGRGFVVAGLLVLILTPVASTIASIIAYAKLKDRAFTLISSGVLAVLLVSFYIGSLQAPDLTRKSTTPVVPFNHK